MSLDVVTILDLLLHPCRKSGYAVTISTQQSNSVLLDWSSTWKLTLTVKSSKPSYNISLGYAGLILFQTKNCGELPIGNMIRKRKWESIDHTLRRGISGIQSPKIPTSGSPRRIIEQCSQRKSWKELKRISARRECWHVGEAEMLPPPRGEWQPWIMLSKAPVGIIAHIQRFQIYLHMILIELVEEVLQIGFKS